MKINRIHLTSFGHFTGQTVDLDHPVNGLRVVVGPNEAGKSTLLQAIRVALFGPSGNMTAGQPTSSMRLSFDFEDDGVSGTISRSGRGAPTTDALSNFDESVLASMVNVDEALFKQLFTIDHDELRRFGEPLLQANGGIGELVFGAALGGQRVKEVSDQLTSELDELFRPTGKTKELNKAIDAVHAADKSLADVLVTADSWADTKADIDRLTSKISEVDDSLELLRSEVSQLERITTVRPQLVRRATLVDTTAAIHSAGPVPPESDWTRLAEVLEQFTESSSAAAELDGQIDARRADREAVPGDRRALEAGADIVALYEQVGVYRSTAAKVARLSPVVAGAHALANADALRSTLADTSPLSEVAAGLPQRTAEVAGTEAEAVATARRLGLDPADLDLVLRVAVPDMTSIETARESAKDLAKREKDAKSAVKDAKSAVKAAKSVVREIESGRKVASAEDIARVREARDDSVKRVRKRLLKGEKPGEPTNEELTKSLETSISDADSAADSVINDTERAAQMLAAQAELGRVTDALVEAERDLALLQDERQAFEDSWTTSWAAAGITAGDPDEMKAWHTSWAGLCDLITGLRSAQAATTADQAQVTAATARLRAALADADTKTPRDSELPGLVEIAQRLVGRHDSLEADRSELAQATAELAALDAAAAPLLELLGPDSTARGDRAISDLESLRQEQQAHEAEARRLESEILNLEGQAADHIATAQHAAEELQGFSDRLQIPLDDLSAASDRAGELAMAQTALQELDEDLISSTGLDVDRLLDEADQAGGPDEVTARIERISSKIDSQSDERDQLVEERRTLQIEFDKATGGSDAAVAQQDVEEALAELGEVTERYMRTALAKAVLDRVVQQGGGSGQSDLIEQAGRLFSHLTAGEFSGIGMEPHGTKTLATAIRSSDSGGVPVYVPSLSDGTQDQLWLSLRLAGVFEHVQQVGAVPVVVDDLLVNFDDSRAGLALEVLAELAQHTQVVVITHHPHLVEIARERIGGGLLRVSELGPRPKNAPMMAQVIAVEEAVSPTPLPRPTEPTATTQRPAREAGGRNVGDAVEALLEALQSGPGRKRDLVERSGIAESDWAPAIKQLVESKLVEKAGHTYRMTTGPSSEAAESEDDE